MHGALGCGLYFLKSGTNPQCIHELLDFLYIAAEKETDNQIFKWKSIIDFEKRIIGYNLSLSHGISSIIIFLSRVIRVAHVARKYKKYEIILQMLSGAVNYLLSQQKDFTQLGSYYPNYIAIESSESFAKSRLAWCYGDLGIGMALWQAGKSTNNLNWKEKGLEVLLKSTYRQKQDNLVRDAGICHGAAGIAMIFRRIYLETGREEFVNPINIMLNQTLHMANFENGLAGYKTYQQNEWKIDYSLLTGISGIGLVLLTYLEDNKQIWDEMFLLSQV